MHAAGETGKDDESRPVLFWENLMNQFCFATFWGTIVLYVSVTVSGQEHDQCASTFRRDLQMIRVAGGGELAVFARAFYPKKPHSSPVMVSLCDNNRTLVWKIRFTSVDYVPGNTCYYALVQVKEDHIFLFSTWNAEYCIVDKRSGEIVEKGKGDDDLKRYDSLLPLKLTLIMGPSTGYESSK